MSQKQGHALLAALSPKGPIAQRIARLLERFDAHDQGSPSSRHTRAAQRKGFNAHDLRRRLAKLEAHSRGATLRRARSGFGELKTHLQHLHGAAARALRHARSAQRVQFRLATLAKERNAAPATKVADPAAENAALATQPAASARDILRAPRQTHASVTECCAGHGIQSSTRRSKQRSAAARAQ